MPSRCVAAGCCNTSKDGVSLHLFPKDAYFREIWTAKVKLTRANWDGPSNSTVLCSAHFPEDSFEEGLYAQFNIKHVRRLKPDAVPVIKLKHESLKKMKRTPRPRPRSATEKRRPSRAMKEIIYADGVNECTELAPPAQHNGDSFNENGMPQISNESYS